MNSTNSPKPNSTNLVSIILLAVVVLIAILIPVLSDHPIRPAWLVVGPLFLAAVLYFTRNNEQNGYLVAGGFAASVILTCLAI